MDILDSAWLIKMLKKSGKLPQERLLSLFDILADWSDAPNIRSQGEPALPASTQLSTSTGAESNTHHLHCKRSTTPDHLLDYLTEEARASGAQLPEALAQQLYFIALGALQESLHAPQQQHFSQHHFGHAKLAAQALIAAQTEPEAIQRKLTRPLAYGIAAGIFVMGMAGGLLLYQAKTSGIDSLTASAASQPLIKQGSTDDDTAEDAPSPKLTAEMYASMEQMRKGDCRYMEVLQIPDADKKVYIENVVGGRVPDNARDMALAQKYLQKISCNYTPMLMKNSVN